MKTRTKLSGLTILGVITPILSSTDSLVSLFISLGFTISDANLINSIIFYVGLLLIILAVILAILRLREKRIKAGTHDIPCSWMYYWRFKIRNHNTIMLEELHSGIYHNFNTLIKAIKDTKKKRAKENRNKRKDKRDNTPLTLKHFETDVDNLLKSISLLFKKCFNLDLSINIYISGEENSKTVLKRNVFLKNGEENRRSLQRENNYLYVITDCPVKEEAAYATNTKAECSKNTNPRYHYNSVFDLIMTSNKGSWFSNDLGVDENKNSFFSSSKYYKEKYYVSLAVFAIIPPSKGKDVSETVRGLLTFDARKTEVFSEEECNLLMGLMAHLIFEVLQELEQNDYE